MGPIYGPKHSLPFYVWVYVAYDVLHHQHSAKTPLGPGNAAPASVKTMNQHETTSTDTQQPVVTNTDAKLKYVDDYDNCSFFNLRVSVMLKPRISTSS